MRPEGLTGATGFRTHREVSPVSIREQSPSLQAYHPAAQKSFCHPPVHPPSRPPSWPREGRLLQGEWGRAPVRWP